VVQYVFHLANGVVDEVVEYCDTLHSAQSLEPPPASAPSGAHAALVAQRAELEPIRVAC
jgi:hypothetical protein